MFGLSVPWIAGIAAAAGLAAGFTGGLKWRAADVAECRADVQARDHALEIQGAAVSRLKTASDAATAEAESARLAAAKAEGEAQAAEAARRAAIKAGKGPATCSAAIAAQRAELVK